MSIVLKGTRGNQPLASSVAIGDLYFVEVEKILEESDGSVWFLHVPSSSGGGTGPTGAQGIQGISGIQGINGLNGLDGFSEDIEPFIPYDNTPNVIPIFGSWTPTLTFGGASVGVVYNTAAGKYVKIGRIVVVSGRMSITAKGSSTGIAYIEGLPFTITGGSDYGSGTSCSKYLNMAGINYWFSTLAEDGTKKIALWNGAPSGVNCQVMTEANFTNTTDFNFQLVYIAVT